MGWNQYWKPAECHAVDPPDWLRAVRKAAQEQAEDCEPITAKQVDLRIRMAPQRARPGADQWQVAQWRSLPWAAKEELADLLNECEKSQAYPEQVLLNVLCQLDKATGGKRTICLTASLYRLHMSIRKGRLQQFEQERAGLWDSAVKGSSCLRAALQRAILGDVAQTLGASMGLLLWDARKFYETIRPEHIARAGLQLGYDPTLLSLGLLVHMAARVLTDAAGISQVVVPTCSILAGCVQSVCWTRLLLYDLLEELHAAYRPVQIRSWVDDLAQWMVGSTKAVVQQMSSCGVALAEGFSKLGFEIADKSVILGTGNEVTNGIFNLLQLGGVHVRTSEADRDLGIDVTLGRQRRTSTQQRRLVKSQTRSKRLRILTKADKRTRSLLYTNVRPAGVWGLQAMGLAPSVLERTRGTWAAASGVHRKGGCTTMAICIDFHMDNDPLVTIPLELLMTWIDIWNDLPEIHRGIRLAWQQIRDRLLHAPGDGY